MTDLRIDLEIDLGDGLPVATATIGPRERATRPTGPGAFRAPIVPITSVPVALTASYAHVHCLSCGSDTRQFLGLFLESRLSNGVRVLARKTLRELAPYATLPRRLDLAPAEATEVCPDCFTREADFRAALAAATVQAELPFAEEHTIAAATTATARKLAIELETDLDDLLETQDDNR